MKSTFVLALVLSTASATPWNRYAARADGIQWGPCEGTNNTQITCGFYDVPLDYQDSSKGNARLAVAKYAAQSSQKLGTLFTNPGGPGESGVGLIVGSLGQVISKIAGGAYDLVSWDPRGVGATIPGPIACFNSTEEAEEFWNNTLLEPQFQVRGNFTDQHDLDYFYSQVDPYEQKIKDLGQKCLQSESGKYLPYVGTAAAVRDMLALSEELDGPNSTIHYWGFSYGTTIGNYFVNMFPERVGRVILDGVQDPLTHASLPSHLAWAHAVESADATYQGFASGCAMAGSYGCPIAGDNATAAGILQWTYDLLVNSYDYSMASKDFDTFSSTNVRYEIHQALYAPTGWAAFANATMYTYWQSLLEASGISFPLASRSLSEPKTPTFISRETTAPDPSLVFTFEAITCGDSIDQNDVTTKTVFDEFVRVCQEVSTFFGAQFPQPAHECHLWPVRAVERYAGPWNNTLATPILVIGNKNDPATPFEDALNVATMLGDSAILIEQDGFGHASIAERSSCSQNIVTAYLVNGTLPIGDDTICSIDADASVLFPMKGVTASAISSSLHDFEGTQDEEEEEESDDDPELAEVKKQKKTLLIVVYALAGVCVMLIVCIILAVCSGRRNKKSYVPVSAQQFEASREVGYTDPYSSGTTLRD